MDFDPRGSRGARDIDHQKIYGFSRGEDERERHETEAREPEPRDPFVRSVDLPRGMERELVQDSRERLYELNGDESRTLATIGAFRVVAERDLGAFRGAGESLEHLRDEKLIRSVPIRHDEKAVVLTDRGWDVLDAHRLDRDGNERQEFHAGVSRPRELRHDAQLFGAYREVERRLLAGGDEIKRVVLEIDLKREYQQFLQQHNRNRADSDGRPDRDEREIATWAREHEMTKSIFPTCASSTSWTAETTTKMSKLSRTTTAERMRPRGSALVSPVSDRANAVARRSVRAIGIGYEADSRQRVRRSGRCHCELRVY